MCCEMVLAGLSVDHMYYCYITANVDLSKGYLLVISWKAVIVISECGRWKRRAVSLLPAFLPVQLAPSVCSAAPWPTPMATHPNTMSGAKALPVTVHHGLAHVSQRTLRNVLLWMVCVQEAMTSAAFTQHSHWRRRMCCNTVNVVSLWPTKAHTLQREISRTQRPLHNIQTSHHHHIHKTARTFPHPLRFKRLHPSIKSKEVPNLRHTCLNPHWSIFFHAIPVTTLYLNLIYSVGHSVRWSVRVCKWLSYTNDLRRKMELIV